MPSTLHGTGSVHSGPLQGGQECQPLCLCLLRLWRAYRHPLHPNRNLRRQCLPGHRRRPPARRIPSGRMEQRSLHTRLLGGRPLCRREYRHHHLPHHHLRRGDPAGKKRRKPSISILNPQFSILQSRVLPHCGTLLAQRHPLRHRPSGRPHPLHLFHQQQQAGVLCAALQDHLARWSQARRQSVARPLACALLRSLSRSAGQLLAQRPVPVATGKNRQGA